jgi:hypothetical protein
MKTKVLVILLTISAVFSNCIAQRFPTPSSGSDRVYCMENRCGEEQHSGIFNSVYTSGTKDRKTDPKADPKAEKILRDYLTAIGGKKSISGIENIVSKVEVLFVEPGIVLTREIIEEKSDKTFIKAFAPQFGEVIRGFDGEVLWEKRQSGIRVIYDAEKSSFLNGSAFMRFCNWERNLTELEYSGIEKIDGADLHKITVKTIYGVKETWYFSASDNLLVRMEEVLLLPQGEISAITTFEDYRQVGGVLHSFSQHVYMPGQTRKISYSEIKHNQVIDNTIFTRPAQ